MSQTLKEIESVIIKIQSIYDKINHDWVKYLLDFNRFDFIGTDGKLKISLKDNTVADINMEKDNILYNLIMEYRQFVVDKVFNLDFDKVRSRIKMANSIQSKIETYNKFKLEKGRVPIIKCLNDICGARIEIEDDVTFDEIITFVSKNFPKLKVIDATKSIEGYRAVHIYFREGRYYFPLELQIWYEKDHDANNVAHVRYKQKYVFWEGEVKSDEIVKKE